MDINQIFKDLQGAVDEKDNTIKDLTSKNTELSNQLDAKDKELAEKNAVAQEFFASFEKFAKHFSGESITTEVPPSKESKESKPKKDAPKESNKVAEKAEEKKTEDEKPREEPQPAEKPAEKEPSKPSESAETPSKESDEEKLDENETPAEKPAVDDKKADEPEEKAPRTEKTTKDKDQDNEEKLNGDDLNDLFKSAEDNDSSDGSQPHIDINELLND